MQSAQHHAADFGSQIADNIKSIHNFVFLRVTDADVVPFLAEKSLQKPGKKANRFFRYNSAKDQDRGAVKCTETEQD
jgi:hypothetical protein